MSLELTVRRQIFTDESTIGILFIDDVFECFTLEDKCRTIKVFGKTAIPQGKYEIILNYSKRFKKIMPLLLDVSDFSGVRIHAGNTAADTNGCILVGKIRSNDFVGQSREAYASLFKKLQKAFYDKDEKIYINIVNDSDSNIGKEC